MKTIIITEDQLQSIVNEVSNLNEMYDPEKLYAKSYIEDVTRKAPKYIKKYLHGLEVIEKNGKEFIRIPQVVYQYITGNF
jgi:hypothetical protein